MKKLEFWVALLVVVIVLLVGIPAFAGEAIKAPPPAQPQPFSLNGMAAAAQALAHVALAPAVEAQPQATPEATIEVNPLNQLYPFGDGLGCEFADGFGGIGTVANMALPAASAILYQANPGAVVKFNGSQMNLRENLLLLPTNALTMPGLPPGAVFAFVDNLGRIAGPQCVASNLQFFRWASVIAMTSYDAKTKVLEGKVVFLPGAVVNANYVQVLDPTGQVWWTP